MMHGTARDIKIVNSTLKSSTSVNPFEYLFDF